MYFHTMPCCFVASGGHIIVIGRSPSFIYQCFIDSITIQLVMPGRATIPTFVPLGEIGALMCPECPARPLNAFAFSLASD